MKKSNRALLGLVLLDALILLGAGWMVLQTRSGAWTSREPDRAIALILSTAGTVVGIITAILLLAFFIHRRNGN